MIGNCDCCDRKNVPVNFSAWDRNNTGIDTTACYLCCGDSEIDPYGELEEAEPTDPYKHCSAMMLSDLRNIKELVGDAKMKDAILADLAEYDRLLCRIQLELSVIVPPKFKVVSNG